MASVFWIWLTAQLFQCMVPTPYARSFLMTDRTEHRFRLRRYKPQRKTLKGMQRIDHLARRLATELDFLKTFGHRCEDDLAFHPGDILTNAHMRPITES